MKVLSTDLPALGPPGGGGRACFARRVRTEGEREKWQEYVVDVRGIGSDEDEPCATFSDRC